MTYYCANCDRKFSSQQALDSHCSAKRQNHEPKRWYCQPCRRWFKTKDGYFHHRTRSLKHRQPVNKSVECHFCNRRFKSPSAYVQHIESGVHGVNRHQVTYAVQALRVVPTITVSSHPGIFGTSFAAIEAAPNSDNEPASSPPIIEVAPGAPLPPQQASRALQLVFRDRRATQQKAGPVIMSSTTYFPADFANLGIPYACHLCFKTFRTIFALTMHMNSAVHDPAAFKCPGRCKKQFSLISGLIQHLESGSCGLASKQEVHSRFEKLTARFSKMLTM